MKNRLKELRHEKNLTLKEVSSQLEQNNLKISPDALAKYERGDREPKLETWQKLADYFNVSVPYLQGYVDEYIDIHDLNEEEQEAYERITDMLSQEYPQTRPEFNWSKIGQLLINSDITEE